MPLKKSQHILKGCIVQRWVEFNPGYLKITAAITSLWKNNIVLIKYCSAFPRKKLVNPKFTDQIRLCKVGNKTMG